MDKQVARRKSYTSADFVGDLQASLLAVRRAQVGVKIVSKTHARIGKRRRLPRGKKVVSGRNRSRAAYCRLNKTSANLRDAGKEHSGIRTVARAQPFSSIENLANA